MSNEIDIFINKFVEEISENNAAIFAGAGMSTSAGYVDWKGLLKPLADEIGLDIESEYDLVSLAQYHFNDNGRHGINQRLLNEVATARCTTENHKILSRLPIDTYWTTNYDKLIEKALEEAGKIPDVKYTNNQLATTRPNRDAIVYKMHGDIDHPDSAVLIKDDYEKYTTDKGPYVNALSGDLVSKTFLFIGFSFTDPNLDYIMSRIRITFKEHQRQHFCFFKKCSEEDYPDKSTFEHASKKLELVIKDLKRFQIKTLLVDEYSQITDALAKIERLYKRRTIFISGSASDFSPWNRADIENFLRTLGNVLVEKDYKLVTGVGLGVGNAIITGAVEAIYNQHNGRINDYLLMRPFPQFIEDEDQRKAVWKQYRKELIGNAGIALFFMGNKTSGDKTILADGVRQEFDIAHELGLAVVPIGATGYMAQEIWNELVKEIGKYYPSPNDEILKKLNALGEPVDHPDQLISKIVDIVNHTSKE